MVSVAELFVLSGLVLFLCGVFAVVVLSRGWVF